MSRPNFVIVDQGTDVIVDIDIDVKVRSNFVVVDIDTDIAVDKFIDMVVGSLGCLASLPA